MRNPFAENSKDLLVLDSRDIVGESAISTVKEVNEIGKKQFNAFMKERIVERTVSSFESIKANKLHLFSCQSPKSKTVLMQQVSTLKQNCSQFSVVYILPSTRGQFRSVLSP